MDFPFQNTLSNPQSSYAINLEDYNGNSEHQRLIGSPYVGSYYWENGDFHFYGPGYEDYMKRQLYLRSYKFTRERTLSDRLMSSLSKFKAAAWAVVACNYRPVLVRRIKETVNSTKRCLSSRVPLALHISKCQRVSA